jgi:para-nitrobenzyl esterase
VLVFIHGGNHANGSASDPLRDTDSGLLYDGQFLAANQSLLVVTLDYRLGVLGFFADAALSGEGSNGNQGLRDQQLALRWVKDNIEAFGGDPSRVSVFGESSGAVDVCFHVASPSSRDLFAGAIGASGGCTTRQPSLEQAEGRAADLVTQLGCTGQNPLACLREKSVASLLDATSSDSSSDSSFGPIVDGDFMPEQPRDLFDAAAIAKVPYLLGSDTDDGTLLTQGQPEISTDADLRTALTRMFTTSTAQILQRYPSSEFAKTSNRYNATYVRIVGDARSVCPTWDVAQRAAAAGSRVYMFNFDVPSSTTLGATQGAELAYVFGSAPAFTTKTQPVIDKLQAYWSSFAATGDPNDASASLAWPAFSEASSARINFAGTSTIKTEFRADECELWRSNYNTQFSAATAQ